MTKELFVRSDAHHQLTEIFPRQQPIYYVFAIFDFALRHPWRNTLPPTFS